MTQPRVLRHWSVVLTTGFLIALASAGLVACGYNGAPSTQPQSQATQPLTPAQRTSPPTRVISTPTTQPPLQSQLLKCGSVHGFGTLEVVPKDLGGEQAENCFWQAFQHCRLATLVFVTNGLHTTLIHTFTIHTNGGLCLITDAKQFGVVSNQHAPATIYTCTGLIQHPRALDVLNCGQEGTVVVLGA